MRALPLGWLMTSIALIGLLGGTVAPVAAQPADDRAVILALYYVWFDWSTWAQPLCDQPQLPYVSADMGAMERHVEQAASVGIDALLQPWYGPRLAGNPTETHFEMLLGRVAQRDLHAALLLDMTGTFLQSADAVSEALRAVQEEHARHAAYLQMDGRPVVFFLGQERLSLPSWEAIRTTIDPDYRMIWIAEGRTTDFLSVFDGLYLHNVATAPQPETPLSWWGSEVRSWSQQHRQPRYWVATVMPGYDETLEDENGLVRARADGAYYSASWSGAEAGNADAVLIRSFNGWTRCTQIEPSETHGRRYLDLTAELIEAYEAPPPETATPVPPMEPPPSPTPTVTSEPVPTETVTPTVEATLSPTPWITPTVTLTPSATPIRLATPVPTTVDRPDGPSVTPASGPFPSTPPRVAQQSAPTPTPVPRLPVEGAAPRRCSLLPLLLPAALFVTVRAWWDRRVSW